MKRLLISATILIGLMLMWQAPTLASRQDGTPSTPAGDRPACAASSGDGATPAAEAGTPAVRAGTELAGWQTTPLTDARTGAAFTVADFLGCTVYVETMATWCGECRHQLENVADAVPGLDRDEFVVVAISVETDLDREDLAAYADEAGFDWLFSVATPDVLKAIVDDLGRGAIVPPSTPHVIVRPDGTYGDLLTGYTEPDEIVRLMTEASGA